MNTEFAILNMKYLLIACVVIILMAFIFSDYDPPPKN